MGKTGPVYIKATFAVQALCLLRVPDLKGVPVGND
jgi:hypothetical protein